MSADEDAIRTVLLTEINRRIIRFCKNPHTSAEIVNETTPARTSDPGYYETLVSNALRILENYGMISFADGKWVSSKISLQILDKYFGG